MCCGGCWCPKCIAAKIGAAVFGALALTVLGGTLASQISSKPDFVTTAGMYLVGIALCFAAKKLMWCCCCCCDETPAKRKK